MEKPDLPTWFLPAERADDAEVRRQHQAVVAVPMVCAMLDAMPNIVLMLNEHRQIIYANKTAREALGVGLEFLLGKRPGEAVSCVHSHEEGGCGSTEFCTTCGAANAIAAALRGKPDARECRIQVEQPNPDLDLKVWATPFHHDGFSVTIFAAVDISHEKRRRILERIFFHDVLNTAGGVKGLSEIMIASAPDDFPELAKLLNMSSERLVDEILSQRDLAAIENGEYQPSPTPCPLKTFLETMASLCATHETARSRNIRVEPGAPEEAIVTDRALLMRVIGNMIKNALEAEPSGSEVRIGGMKTAEGCYALWVRNPTPMPRQVQLQVFQRSFSTKGEGRGLGTYSIKLLTKRFLKGKASFRCEPGLGTEFRVDLPATIARG